MTTFYVLNDGNTWKSRAPPLRRSHPGSLRNAVHLGETLAVKAAGATDVVGPNRRWVAFGRSVCRP
jgi:hypothetical protein